jgi:hypothetical protein
MLGKQMLSEAERFELSTDWHDRAPASARSKQRAAARARAARRMLDGRSGDSSAIAGKDAVGREGAGRGSMTREARRDSCAIVCATVIPRPG